MKVQVIKYCPCTLQPGYTSYSPTAQKLLFGSRSKNVPHILPEANSAKQPVLNNEIRKQISFSGVQEKYSLKLERNKLLPTMDNGTHILKPVPAERLERVRDLPANEHVSMQIASQVYGIHTAACGMIFFSDGSPAYLTKRFDIKPGGKGKYQVEDFASLLSRTPEKGGVNYKYDASYLDIAMLIHLHVAAAPVVLLEYFRILVFNYLIGNGDAHLKNFSLMETDHGDFMLSPAYDLLCTAIHINDSSLALNEGLYENDFKEAGFDTYGFYTAASFIAFAEKAAIKKELAQEIIDQVINGIPRAIELVQRSFLSKESKKIYLQMMKARQLNLLQG